MNRLWFLHLFSVFLVPGTGCFSEGIISGCMYGWGSDRNAWRVVLTAQQQLKRDLSLWKTKWGSVTTLPLEQIRSDYYDCKLFPAAIFWIGRFWQPSFCPGKHNEADSEIRLCSDEIWLREKPIIHQRVCTPASGNAGVLFFWKAAFSSLKDCKAKFWRSGIFTLSSEIWPEIVYFYPHNQQDRPIGKIFCLYCYGIRFNSRKSSRHVLIKHDGVWAGLRESLLLMVLLSASAIHCHPLSGSVHHSWFTT